MGKNPFNLSRPRSTGEIQVVYNRCVIIHKKISRLILQSCLTSRDPRDITREEKSSVAYSGLFVGKAGALGAPR